MFVVLNLPLQMPSTAVLPAGLPVGYLKVALADLAGCRLDRETHVVHIELKISVFNGPRQPSVTDGNSGATTSNCNIGRIDQVRIARHRTLERNVTLQATQRVHVGSK